MKKVLAVLITVVLFSISSAYARPYVGIGTGFGFGSSSIDPKVDDEGYGNYGTEVNNKSFLNNVYVGYSIIKYFAIEAEYDYGFSHADSSTNNTQADDPSYNQEYKDENKYSMQSGFVNLVGKLPLFTNHIPFIKVGFGYSQFKDTATNTTHETSLDSKDQNIYKAGGFSYKIGLGYEYMISKHHSIMAEYDYVSTPKLDGNQDYISDYSDGEYDDHSSYPSKFTGKTNYSIINVSYKFTF